MTSKFDVAFILENDTSLNESIVSPSIEYIKERIHNSIKPQDSISKSPQKGCVWTMDVVDLLESPKDSNCIWNVDSQPSSIIKTRQSKRRQPCGSKTDFASMKPCNVSDSQCKKKRRDSIAVNNRTCIDWLANTTDSWSDQDNVSDEYRNDSSSPRQDNRISFSVVQQSHGELSISRPSIDATQLIGEDISNFESFVTTLDDTRQALNDTERYYTADETLTTNVPVANKKKSDSCSTDVPGSTTTNIEPIAAISSMHSSDLGLDYVAFDMDSQQLDSNANSKQPKRRCSMEVANVLQPVRRKRNKIELSTEQQVQDIYLNKLWKTQMPKEKCWPTIHELPVADRCTGAETYFTKRQYKCRMKFDDEPSRPSAARVNQRRQKALKHGWKPPTKKHLTSLDKILADKLSALDKELNDQPT